MFLLLCEADPALLLNYAYIPEGYIRFSLLACEQSERDTIRGVQIRAGAVRIYIYVCMEVRMS